MCSKWHFKLLIIDSDEFLLLRQGRRIEAAAPAHGRWKGWLTCVRQMARLAQGGAGFVCAWQRRAKGAERRGRTAYALPLRLFRTLGRRPEPKPASTDGRRLYAVGDVHGRLDLLDPLLDLIRQDAADLGDEAKPVLIFVGDYVDRGAYSKGVIDRVIELQGGSEFEVRALKGNHEEAMLAFLADPNFGPTWTEHGGAQTLASYGVTPPIFRMDDKEWEKACEAFAEVLPPAHFAFLTGLELMVIFGDYVFVHAGLRPGVPLEAQREQDLLWIRQDFLGVDRPFEKIVVHGHTPTEEAFLGRRRIGIDTGAYATGVLTAVRLDAGERRFIQFSVRVRR